MNKEEKTGCEAPDRPAELCLPRYSRRASPGFSMAEIAIALFILALGLLSVIALFPAAVHFGDSAISRNKALSLSRTAEAVIAYSNLLGQLEQGQLSWTPSGSMGNTCYYPGPTTTTADDWDPSYSWNAWICRGGSTGGVNSYLATVDRLYYVQIRVYRNYPQRTVPIDVFETFMTR